ncbi:hypothetical protein Hypma_012419 [Hypsizygus marmoreus]|uniref:Ent-kaurene oxidase n=1 Tax=Hypsizygus marmoreus TaxID=39966 RepID=A0A369JNT1_HYPMA|nr:hypothetical protein Hypma_012419 [Hypsizygus marmoreus]
MPPSKGKLSFNRSPAAHPKVIALSVDKRYFLCSGLSELLTRPLTLDMANTTRLASMLAGVFSAFYVASGLLKSWTTRHNLNKIPTVGPSGILSSYLRAYRFLRNAGDMIKKYPGTAFKFPMVSKWMIVVSGPQMVDDLRKATDDLVSFRDAVADALQVDYTIGSEIHHEPYHVSSVRSPLTRNLAVRFPDVQDEIMTAFAEYIPLSEEWTSVLALPTIMKIVCRTSNRLFVGLPLCRNPEYGVLNVDFTIDVIKAGQIINLFPNISKPIAGHLFTNVEAKIGRAIEHLRPNIQEHFDKEEQYGLDWPSKPNDLLSWLLENAKGHQRSVRDLTVCVLAVNFAAIHTTSMLSQSYVPAIREEIETVIKEEGLTKLSLHKVRLLDSFSKESQRHGGSGAYLWTGEIASLKDSASTMVSLGLNYIVFGNGRHACPGRFFAANEIKAMLGHVLLNYDVTFGNSVRPPDRWYGMQAVPDPTAMVLFRRRCA